MKRLMILSVLTLLTVSSLGCGRNWGSLFNRNDACQPQCEMYYPQDDGIVYEGPVMNTLPPGTTILPEPASSSGD